MTAIGIRAAFAAAACACLLHQSRSRRRPRKHRQGNGGYGSVGQGSRISNGLLPERRREHRGSVLRGLEAAKAAIAADRERQVAINAQIEEDFNNIDPMVKAQRMQQWMMSNPQEAMAFAQAAQAAPAQAEADIATLTQQTKAPAEAWSAVRKSYDDARIAAYAPIEPRRKALAASRGYAYSAAPKDLAVAYTGFFQDPATSSAEWAEGEQITKALNQAYEGMCPQWWGANGKAQAFMKQQKAWFISERIPFLQKGDGPLLQQYAMMSTPAATIVRRRNARRSRNTSTWRGRFTTIAIPRRAARCRETATARTLKGRSSFSV